MTQRISKLLERVGDLLRETISTSHPMFDSAKILSFINYTIDEMSHLAWFNGWSDLYQRYDISLVADQQYYTLPPRCREIGLIQYWPSGSQRPNDMVQLTKEQFPYYLSDNPNTPSNSTLYWALLDGQIFFPVAPSEDKTDALHVFYWTFLPHVHTGALGADGTSTTVFTLPAEATLGDVSWDDDYYNGFYIYFTGGDNSGERRKISDYTASTRTVTVSSAFSNTPAISDTYEILSPLPEALAEVIVLGATVRALSTINEQNAIFMNQLYESKNRASLFFRRTSGPDRQRSRQR